MKVRRRFLRNLFVLTFFNLISFYSCERTPTIEIEGNSEIFNDNPTTENGMPSSCSNSEKCNSETIESSTILDDKTSFPIASTQETSSEDTPESQILTTPEDVINRSTEIYTIENRISTNEFYNNPTETTDRKVEVIPQNIFGDTFPLLTVSKRQTSLGIRRGSFKSTTVDLLENSTNKYSTESTVFSAEFGNANEYEVLLTDSSNLDKTSVYKYVPSTTPLNSEDDQSSFAVDSDQNASPADVQEFHNVKTPNFEGTSVLPTALTPEASMETADRDTSPADAQEFLNFKTPIFEGTSALSTALTPEAFMETADRDTSPVDAQEFHNFKTPIFEGTSVLPAALTPEASMETADRDTSPADAQEFHNVNTLNFESTSALSTALTPEASMETVDQDTTPADAQEFHNFKTPNFEGTTSEFTTVDSSKNSTTTYTTPSSMFPIFSNGTEYESSSKSYESVVTSTTAPNCEVNNISRISSDIGMWNISTTWTIETNNSFNALTCNMTLVLSCEEANENDISAISTNKTKVININPSIILTGLEPFTNYSCESELENSDGIIVIGNSFDITTSFDVPSKVDFIITNITANNFTIQWKEPSSFPGYTKVYYIAIEDKGPRHHARSSDSNNITYSLKDEDSGDKILVHRASPNFLYEIQIFAGNEKGNGTSEIKLVITNSSRSTEPLNVTSDVQIISNHCNGTKYNSTLHLKWELPLNTNGELENFQIEIVGSKYFGKFSVLSTQTDVTNISYNLYVPNLNASTKYNYSIMPITVKNIEGYLSSGSIASPDGCPSKPTTIVIKKITSSGFYINWKAPEDFYGKISKYDVEIKVNGSNHFHSISTDSECHNSLNKELAFNTPFTFWKFDEGLPDYNYQITTRAWTSAGTSENSEYEYVTTTSAESMPVRDVSVVTSGHKITDEIYEYYVTISFKMPCNTNGKFISYLLKYYGHRYGYPDDNNTCEETNIHETNKQITLKNAGYTYSFEISVVTEHHSNTFNQTNKIETITGVPPANPAGINYEINIENPTQIDTVLKKNMFNNTNGNILYYAIILMPTNGSTMPKKFNYGEWNEKWPSANETVLNYGIRKDVIQLTRNFWNPFNESINTIAFSIGETSNCQLTYCYNLIEDTNYILITRGLTNNTYSDIYSLIKTGKNSSNIWKITTLVFFCLLLIVSAIYLYSKKWQSIRIKFKPISNANTIEDIPRHVISVKNISSYYNKITNDPEILRQQYKEIEDETRIYKEQHVKNDFALKSENRRKNRYINILPYDENRIKLNIDEDDEISSDYINASYIKGFSGEIEYIASQGPLEHTCKDFWKMVMQKKVSVIVMVSHFVENEKEKCFKYFPKNYENLLICEDLEVKCLTELKFDSYCVRTLLVRKGIKQYSVVHMQYLDWPDFGCPSGTSNMLFFCQEVRDRIKLEKGLMVVHCSAGVGRTGTLISLDILLQAVKKKKKEISIFETVLQLRKQRTHMVQTEKQYVYLHTCIKDALENEAIYLRQDGEQCEDHTYKNIQNYLDNDFRTEQESVF